MNASITQYSRDLLTAFDTPIADDRIEALIHMMVGSKRVQLLADLTGRMRNFFKPRAAVPQNGACFEAVLGEFGAGKSHIGYLLKQNVLTMAHNVLVCHVQITGEADFNATVAALLRSLRLSGTFSSLSYGVELSAYANLFRWCGSSIEGLRSVCYEAVGNLNNAAGHDFAVAVAEAGSGVGNPAALQRFIEGWVLRATPKQALETFELVMRVFAKLKVRRLALLIDEFEAMQALDDQHRMQVLQSLQDLHDDFAGRMPGLPSTYLVAFSTRDWWERAGNILPSLAGPNQRVKTATPIPDIDDVDVVSLIHRYIGLYTLAHSPRQHPTQEMVDQAATEVIAESAGMMHHMRSIHSRIRNRVEALLEV